MDPDFANYYQRELHYIRPLFGEFVEGHPKIGRRLGAQTSGEVADPGIERLLQAFSASAARSQIHIDRMPGAVPHRLLECVHPNYVTPLPSMAIVQFRPGYKTGQGIQGQLLPRGTPLTSRPSGENSRNCEFRTSQDVTVYPLSISFARLTGVPPDIPNIYRYVFGNVPVRSALRLRIRTTNGLPISNLNGLDRLPIYLSGDPRIASYLFELIHTSTLASVTAAPGRFAEGTPRGVFQNGFFKGQLQTAVDYEGLAPEQSLLPPAMQHLHGHNLAHEFFAFEPRFWFFALTGLAGRLAQIEGPEAEIVLLLSREVEALQHDVDASQFALFCSPVTNLFQVRTEKLDVERNAREHRLVPYPEAPDDFEVHSLHSAVGQVNEHSEEIIFEPLHAAIPNDERGHERYFALRRELDEPASNVRRYATRQSLVRTTTWLTLFGAGRMPDDSGIHHLTLDVSLTNGNLPCLLQCNGVDDLIANGAKSVSTVGFVRAPTLPKPPLARGRDVAWKLIRQLTLEHDVFDDEYGAERPGQGLRQLLEPYVFAGDPSMQRRLDALIGASASAVNDFHGAAGDLEFTRGIELTLTFDEAAFDGYSPFTFALALEHYLTRHVSQHSFTRTALHTVQRGAVFTWPARDGTGTVF
ncbi:type VI secretion system baseplate subunit TssF [Caballeronia sp. GAFFF1]|uniref:type VI secretion system baseplate subunit TssF n=1 Tax=Caballeronia sp. GAFFF1 TaxID=2921779 RepID=UPI002028C461|nr:type VI secretion system baseplate subunit TssF [Caballeronia sp. GAFFF1]